MELGLKLAIEGRARMRTVSLHFIRISYFVILLLYVSWIAYFMQVLKEKAEEKARQEVNFYTILHLYHIYVAFGKVAVPRKQLISLKKIACHFF